MPTMRSMTGVMHQPTAGNRSRVPAFPAGNDFGPGTIKPARMLQLIVPGKIVPNRSQRAARERLNPRICWVRNRSRAFPYTSYTGPIAGNDWACLRYVTPGTPLAAVQGWRENHDAGLEVMGTEPRRRLSFPGSLIVPEGRPGTIKPARMLGRGAGLDGAKGDYRRPSPPPLARPFLTTWPVCPQGGTGVGAARAPSRRGGES